MKRRNFLAGLSAVAAASCARMDQRKERYDTKECPFCSVNPGVCSYCNGTKKCNFCNGTGKRLTSTKNYPDEEIKKVTYEEDCPYCKSTGVCRYCDGTGKCWACKGTGRIESWDFEEKYKESIKKDEKNNG